MLLDLKGKEKVTYWPELPLSEFASRSLSFDSLGKELASCPGTGVITEHSVARCSSHCRYPPGSGSCQTIFVYETTYHKCFLG